MTYGLPALSRHRHASSVSILLGFLLFGCHLPAHAQTSAPSDTAADALFHDGKLAAAQDAYRAVSNRDHSDFQAHKRLGALALYAGHLDEARTELKDALTLKPTDPAANTLMGETLYRKDEFAQAAPYFKAAGNEAKAEMLASYDGRIPYRIQSDAASTSLPFLANASPETGDLPVVEVRVNGGKAAHFLIDTGGAEIVLDGAFAKEAGATTFAGAIQGTFAGGKHAPVLEGRVDSLTLGAFVVQNVPVQILDLSGVKIDGVIGTVLLY